MTKELRKRVETFCANSDNAVAKKLLADLALEIGQYETIADEIVHHYDCGCGESHSPSCWVGRLTRLAELR